MTKKKRDASGTGITAEAFDALVEEGFQPSAPRKRGGIKPWVPPDDVIAKLEEEGADPRLTPAQARFSAVLSRCLGVPPRKQLDNKAVKFLQDFDSAARAVAQANNIELRDDKKKLNK